MLAKLADQRARSGREAQRQKDRTVVTDLEKWTEVSQFTQHGRLVRESRKTVLVDPEEDEKKEEALAFASLNKYDLPEDVKVPPPPGFPPPQRFPVAESPTWLKIIIFGPQA